MARLASHLGAKAGANQPGTEVGAHRLGTKELGAKAPVAIIIVQHIPPGFSTAVAHSLTQTTANAIRVREACITRDESAPLFEVPTLLTGCEPWPLHAEDVVLAPGGYHVRVVEGPGVELSLDPPVAGVRPAVDVTLLSAVPVMGPRILAVILTGMGIDGLRGATAVRQAGGRVIAQDQATSVVYGMPRAVVEAGQADEVLPLEGIADALASWWNGDAA
ncbi:MAG TPA: chemotaxis protein CheB [Firmicutes bacterium]|nr:chemotaxis protein CheB [Bacillota bacterium]